MAVVMCLPTYDQAPLLDRLPRKQNHSQSPAYWQGPPTAPQAPIFQDPLPTAAGYYAETGTDRDSGTPLLPPPSASLKREGLLQSCSRGGRGIVEDMCYERLRAEGCVD